MSPVRYVLHVTVPSNEVFSAYWYGYGKVLDIVLTAPNRHLAYVVDYGDDQYRAEYQAARFASGLYFARVETVES